MTKNGPCGRFFATKYVDLHVINKKMKRKQKKK